MRRWIASVDNIDALSRYAADAAAVTGVLMAGGVGALATCRALTGLHDALTVRLIELAEAQLGPAPCRYAWLALGSGGRMEQSLCTDQDHAIAYADDGAPDRYFGALGAHVVAGLARARLRRATVPGGDGPGGGQVSAVAAVRLDPRRARGGGPQARGLGRRGTPGSAVRAVGRIPGSRHA